MTESFRMIAEWQLFFTYWSKNKKPCRSSLGIEPCQFQHVDDSYSVATGEVKLRCELTLM